MKNVNNSDPSQLHPTAQGLVDTVKEMLIHTPYNAIKSESVLTRSGTTRGPLYHHFENFEELIEVAQAQIYQDYVLNLVSALTKSAIALEDPMATREEFAKILQLSEVGNTLEVRRLRVGLIYNAASIGSFGRRLAVTQEALNGQWIHIYQIAVEKGWADPEISPRAVAVLVQAAFFGRILDDISPTHMNSKDWLGVMTRLMDCLFFSTALAKSTHY
jgi:AcrR family transcriptional regulator